MIEIKDGYIGAMSDGSYVRFMLDANGNIYYHYNKLHVLSATHDGNGKSYNDSMPDIVAVFGYTANMEEYYKRHSSEFVNANRKNIDNRVPLWHKPSITVKVLASEILEKYKADTIEIIQDEEDVIFLKQQ